ncbi:MAG TPA: hypothetical protein VIJ49_03915, partial [Aestuariivirga sp.]
MQDPGPRHKFVAATFLILETIEPHMLRRPASVALLAFFAVIVGLFCLFAPNFATTSNFENLMSGFSFVAILAMGQSFPILLRG